MRKSREALRLHFVAAMSIRAIARSLNSSPSTVREYLRRAEAAGLDWSGIELLDEAALERRLFPAPGVAAEPQRPLPDWAHIHQELRQKGVTLALLWQEYKAVHPEGLQYSWFCQRYRDWHCHINRQEHSERSPSEHQAHVTSDQTADARSRNSRWFFALIRWRPYRNKLPMRPCSQKWTPKIRQCRK